MSTAIGMLTQTGMLGERVLALVNLNWDFSGAGEARRHDPRRVQS